MHTTSRFLARLSVVALLTALSSPCLASRDVEVRQDAPDDTMRDELVRLRSEGAEERRRIVEEDLGWIVGLDFGDPENEEARFAVAALADLLRAEPDDWIASKLLRRLLAGQGVLLDPLFREALRGPSPNRRWSAIRYFRSRQDPKAVPLLEDSWQTEKRPWVVTDLIGALTVNGSFRFLDDFRRLAWSSDEEVAEAALQAMVMSQDEDCLEDLIGMARDGCGPMRRKALEGLSSWPGSFRALDALTDASRSDDADLERAAASALGAFRDDAAASRLMEMARAQEDDSVRYEALDSLARLQPDGFVDLLLDLIEEAPTATGWNIQRKALEQLRRLADAPAQARLEGLQVSTEAPEGLVDLVQDLSAKIEEASGDKKMITFTWGCMTPVLPRFRIDPGGYRRTVRCWERPDSPGDPEEFPRIPAGPDFLILDYFEQDGVSWAEVSGPEVAHCWVPLETVLPAFQDGEAVPGEADGFRREVDLPIEELRSVRVARLREAGLLETFDLSDAVAGVALTANPARPETIPLLLEACRDDGSILSEQIRGLLRALQGPDPLETESESSWAEGTEEGAAPEEAEDD